MGWTDKLAELLRLKDEEKAYIGYPQMQVGLNKPRQAGYATGFLEGATGADSMQPKNPITDPNYESYEQGKNTGELAGIGAMALPGYAMALRAGAPKAAQAIENYMVKTGGIIPLEAWHGTPHKIEGGFDIKKVGTGEGAQAYGHGMYFAENPKVASQYAVPNDEIVPKAIVNNIRQIYDQRVKTGGSTKEAINEARNQMQYMAENAPTPTVKQLYYDGVNNVERIVNKPLGNMYKVDIPDEQIPNMLDWDLPINQQSTKVQEIAKQLDPNLLADTPHLIVRGQPRHWTEVVDSLKDLQNPKVMKLLKKIYGEASEVMPYGDYLASKMTGEQLYRNLSNPTQWSKEAAPYAMKAGMEDAAVSAKLNELGIKGVRYKDAMSRGVDDGTSNFVVFDPSTVKILEENSKPVSRKELLEEQVKKLKD
jgi:hypothetical protein